MSNGGGGMGGCLVTILLILVFLAAFGFVDWSTVGSFAKFIVAIIVVGLIFAVGFLIWGYLSNNDK